MRASVLCNQLINTLQYGNITNNIHFVNLFSARSSPFDSSVVWPEQVTAQEITNSPAVAAICLMLL